MGKKNKTALGRAVLKDRSKAGSSGKGKESWLHTSELDDGEDWARLNTKSVTEQTALEEFLATAELAGTEFVAEKLNISVYNADQSGGLPSKREEQHIQEIQDQHRQFLQIPRRPKWDESTTPEQLDQLEKDNFLSWRRGLAELQEKDELILTPFERNLEFWRQLWRVIERSDVVVQIVDARNPLLFRCEDLENYVMEVNNHKVNVLLINKADFLTQKQRESWAAYFKSINVKAVFWSAVFETERLKQLKLQEESKSTPLQPEVVTEKPEAVLTDSHVTQFLNLKEPDSTEADNQLLSLDHPRETDSDPTGNYPGAVDPTRSDPRVKDPTRSDPGECVPTRSGPGESYPTRSDVSESDATGRSPRKTATSNVKNDLRENKTSQNDSAQSQANNIPEIDKLNLLRKDVINEDLQESTSVSADAASNCLIEAETGKRKCLVDGRNVEFYTSGHLVTGEELLAYCQRLHRQYGAERGETGRKENEAQTVIGLVGYPNVGKSSTINAILQCKKVPVSATPGRTKHFQTLLVDKSICLCDCPGLVFPSFVTTKAEMVVSGILPIDQMRDHVPPVTLVCRRIPRNILESVYGIKLVEPEEWEDPHRPPFAEELLDAYSFTCEKSVPSLTLANTTDFLHILQFPRVVTLDQSNNRGYITSQARPECARSARYVLKDYVNGKLLYCHPPPTVEAKAFQTSFTADAKSAAKRPPPASSKPTNRTHVEKMDSEFFRQEDVKFHTSAATGTEQHQKLIESRDTSDPNMVIVSKPWKKHGNRNKREKLRRLKPTAGY